MIGDIVLRYHGVLSFDWRIVFVDFEKKSFHQRYSESQIPDDGSESLWTQWKTERDEHSGTDQRSFRTSCNVHSQMSAIEKWLDRGFNMGSPAVVDSCSTTMYPSPLPTRHDSMGRVRRAETLRSRPTQKQKIYAATAATYAKLRRLEQKPVARFDRTVRRWKENQDIRYRTSAFGLRDKLRQAGEKA